MDRPESDQRPPRGTSAAVVPPLPPPPGAGPWYPPPEPPRRSGWWTRVLASVFTAILLGSITLNLYFGAYFAQSLRGPTETHYAGSNYRQRVVILPIRGLIDEHAATFVRQSLSALSDAPPKALVLRVDSGGGAVSAADQIWHHLDQFKQAHAIPVVASFGSVAASGGYYVAAPADAIFAEPTTITGSIGVIAEAFTFPQLLDKIGVTPEVVVASGSQQKDILSPYRPWTDQDRQVLRAVLDTAYNRFVDIVDQGRKDLDADQVRALATGAIYTTQQAIANKLVDSEGYLDDAIMRARQLAGISDSDDPRITVMTPAHTLGLSSLLNSSSSAPTVTLEAQARRWLAEWTTPRIVYRLTP